MWLSSSPLLRVASFVTCFLNEPLTWHCLAPEGRRIKTRRMKGLWQRYYGMEIVVVGGGE